MEQVYRIRINRNFAGEYEVILEGKVGEKRFTTTIVGTEMTKVVATAQQFVLKPSLAFDGDKRVIMTRV